MMKELAVFCYLFILINKSFVAPEESIIFVSNVYEYNPLNIREQIKKFDGNFILFYAPWCSHCTEFQPIWWDLADMVNKDYSKFAIAQVDCIQHAQLCRENKITGYPTLLYFHKNTFTPVEYKGTRDLPSLTLFLSEVFVVEERVQAQRQSRDVNIYSGVAYLHDQNMEKYVSKGQHFIMFYAQWCRACQRLAPIWADLAVHYTHHDYIKIGKINCMENEMSCQNFDVKQFPTLMWIVNGKIMGIADSYTLEDLTNFAEKMVLAENHDPNKFMKKKKYFPVARISEETFETFLERDLVFINYFAPWCAHCMQMNGLWLKLGETFQNETRVLIADVDCVQSKPICEAEKIHGLPTLVLYKHKKIVNVDFGGRPLDSLITLVRKQLLSRTSPSNDMASPEVSIPKDEL